MASNLFEIPSWGDDVPSTSFSFKKKQNKTKVKATKNIEKPITHKPKATIKPQESVAKKQTKKINKSKGDAINVSDDTISGRFVRINPSSPMVKKKQKSNQIKLAANGNSFPNKKGKFSEKPTIENGTLSKKAKKRPSPNVLAGSKKAQAAVKRLISSKESNDEDDEELANDVLAFRNSLMGKLKKAGPAAVTFSDSEAESIDLEDEAPPSKKPKFTKPIKEAPLPVKDTKDKPTKKLKPDEAISEEEDGSEETDAPSSFRDKLIGNLKGSRFRFLNEKLYSTEGSGGLKLFKEDKGAFKAYHEGYRQQVQQWPLNPLDRIIKSIKKLPKTHVIADFGCGEGRLARSVPQKTYSLDLVANRHEIIACDMANTPLETGSIDVAVYCLSLMGTNLRDFLLEANRVLKTGGQLKIAEVESRFADVRQFIDSVKACGFQLASQDLSNKLFVFINFKKIQNIDKSNKRVPAFSLKPCLYKKR